MAKPYKTKTNKVVSVDTRMTQGLMHEHESVELADELASLDAEYGGGVFDLEVGDEGSNLEHLMYLLDIHFNPYNKERDDERDDDWDSDKLQEREVRITMTEIKPVASHWDESSRWPVCDWQCEVSNDETRLGYHEWVENQAEIVEEEEAKATCTSEQAPPKSRRQSE